MMAKNRRPADFDDEFDDNFDDNFDNGLLDEFGSESGDDDEFDDSAVLLDDDWENDDELLGEEYAGFAPPPTCTFDQLLLRLSSAPAEIAPNDYFALSDLTRAEVETVRQLWPKIDPVSRRQTVETLARATNEYLNVDISAFWAAIIDDPDTAVRQLVLETLDENEPKAELLGPLIYRLQQDSADEVRAAAASVLGHYVLAGELDELEAAPAIRAEDALLAVLTNAGEPVSVQRRALESIAFSGEMGVRQFIEDAYYSPWEEMRVSALTAMGRSADIRWRRMVRAELRSPSPAMRTEAAIAFNEFVSKYETVISAEDVLDRFKGVADRLKDQPASALTAVIEKLADHCKDNAWSAAQAKNVGAFSEGLGGELLVTLWNAVSKTGNLPNIQKLHKLVGKRVVEAVKAGREVK